jgi:hypothetical protein
MKKFSVALLALVAAVAMSPSVWADNVSYTVTTSGATGSGEAQLNLILDVNSSGVVQGIGSGSWVEFNGGSDQFAINGLVTGETLYQEHGPLPINTGAGKWGGTPGTFDQTLSTKGLPLDAYGLALTLANGGELQVYITNNPNNPENYGLWIIDESYNSFTGAYTNDTYAEPVSDLNPPAPNPPAVTPEPGTLGLFGTGLLGLAGLLRSKFMGSR